MTCVASPQVKNRTNNIMERADLSALIVTLVISSVLVPESHAYCWQAGWNPGFKVSFKM